MIYEIYNPDTGEYCHSVDTNDKSCYSRDCGGCSECTLAQAIHWGYNIFNVEDGFLEEHF